jgi:Asp-tRNA(Asn)/Glu-tRNA(Gln) amidotransferase A subunit family amidase
VQLERSDYDAALQLRTDFADIMRTALSASSVMLMPLLAGAAPRVKRSGSSLDKAGQAIADLTVKFAAFVAMSGCPAAVLPVPPLDGQGAPWSVMVVGRHRCDMQLLQLAVRLSSHVQRTAVALSEVCRGLALTC